MCCVFPRETPTASSPLNTEWPQVAVPLAVDCVRTPLTSALLLWITPISTLTPGAHVAPKFCPAGILSTRAQTWHTLTPVLSQRCSCPRQSSPLTLDVGISPPSFSVLAPLNHLRHHQPSHPMGPTDSSCPGLWPFPPPCPELHTCCVSMASPSMPPSAQARLLFPLSKDARTQ